MEKLNAPGIIVWKMIFENTSLAHNIFCFCDFGVFIFCDFACDSLVEHCLGKPRPRNHTKKHQNHKKNTMSKN